MFHFSYCARSPASWRYFSDLQLLTDAVEIRSSSVMRKATLRVRFKTRQDLLTTITPNSDSHHG